MTMPDVADPAWRLFGLNSNFIAQNMPKEQKKQYHWLKSELTAQKGKGEALCAVAFWHAPVFSSGHHGHDESKDYKNALPRKQNDMADEEALLYASGVSVILNGHDHNFEELLPHDPQGHFLKDSGIRSFVVGTGGRQLYSIYKKTYPSISKHYDSATNGILKLSLKAGSYKWEFIATKSGGKAKYSGSGTCNKRTGT